MKERGYIKGRGAQSQERNRFSKQEPCYDWDEGIDEYTQWNKINTKLFYETPKKLINKVESEDVNMLYSANPYQGCEHGCIYCYARNSHEYWGFNPGLDFESKIIVKKNAAQLLEKELNNPNWKVSPVVLSGNTDCYQPIEQKLRITRSLLKVFAKYRHPVGIITKNTQLLNDMDLLQDLASDNLIRVILSITTMDNSLRTILEPRTSTAQKKFQAIELLSKNNIPVSIMNAPIIPGLNDTESPGIIKKAAEHGALDASYTIVRLNGQLDSVFKRWLNMNYPDRSKKVWNKIKAMHEGSVSDNRIGFRMKGSGEEAEVFKKLFLNAKKKYMHGGQKITLNCKAFRKGGTLPLFTDQK